MEKTVEQLDIDTNLPLESLLNLILNYSLSAIDAKAGSLMTVNHERKILQIKSRLGAPKKGRTGEPFYALNGNSIASKAVNEKQPILKNNLTETVDFVSSRSENKIQSILSVPIIHDGNVIAVINADSEKKNDFTEKNQEELEKIASAIAPLVAERISFLDAIKEVSMELLKSPTEGDVEKVLQKIADVAVKSLGIDIVTLYEYDQKTNEFIVEGKGPKIGGKLKNKEQMRTRVYKEDVPYQVIEKRKPLFFKNVEDVDFLTKDIKRQDGKNRPRFVKRESIKSMAALLLPNRAFIDKNEEIVGVIFANYKNEHDFNVDEEDALATFADYAATAILTSRKEKQRREELKKLEKSKTAAQLKKVLDKIVNAVMGHFQLNDVLEKIIKTSMETLQAEACSIYIEDKEKDPGVLKCIAGAGFAENIVGKARYKFGEGLTGKIAKEGITIIIKDRSDLEAFKEKEQWKEKAGSQEWDLNGKFKNMIAVPIKIKDQTMGVIQAENKISPKDTCFTDDDLESLILIGTVIGLTIDNVRLHKKTEEQLKTIAGKAAHRIFNQATNYDGIQLALEAEIEALTGYDPQHLQTILQRLKTTTQSLKRMTDEFKSYGKPLKLDRTLVNIHEIITQEIQLADESVKKPENRQQRIIDADIISDFDPGLSKVSVDVTRFAEAIKELLRNSLKALSKQSPPKGTINVSTKRIPAERMSSISDKPSSGPDFVRITIQDNGPGLPDKFPVFEPFHSTDPNSTGLGLVTVKELIEAHHGSVRIGKCKGFRIEMELPMS